jgi:CheY-like chemotaxis protein/HPt (histidine-containing phosphotransfer) domain-containing protein
MNESKNFRVALLSGGSPQWRDAITPLLLAQTDCLVMVETVDELLSLQSAARPDMIFLCHQPGDNDGIVAAERIRIIFTATPLVLLAAVSFDTLKAAVAVGASSILEPPFSESSFITVFSRCCRLAQALRLEELKQQQNRIRAELFMQSSCCHLFVDADGKVTFLNDGAAKIVVHDKNSATEFSEISKRFFAPHASTYPLEMEMAVHSRTAWNGILAGRLPDATVQLYRVICAPLTLMDAPSGMLVTLHDITDEHKIQAQLRISLQVARDCLALASLYENSELEELCSPNCFTPVAQETFSLSALLESVMNTGRTGTADMTLPDYIPKYFRGDARRLGYALQAVSSGSARFGEGAPRISISIKERTPARMTIQFNIRVECGAATADSYQGIADYLVSSGDMPNAATGLGLAAILIEQLNGTLLIRTERRISRTVCCTVPLLTEADELILASSATSSADSPDTIPAARVSPMHADAPEAISALKILVAEDNLMEQATLKHLLEGIGCQVIVVGNGKEAVDEYETGEFDAILMDILMPVMDGFEATRLIRERERIIGGKIPVVALTSYSLKAIHEKCVSVGMNGYLAKPVARTKLLEALQRLCMPPELSAQTDVITSDLNGLPVLEARSILENNGYDLELYRDLIGMYLANYAGQGKELAEKLAGDDLKDILSTAHSLKGTVSNIGGQRLAEVGRHIQDICHEGKKPDSTVWAPIVEAQTAAFNAALENLDWSVLERYVAEQFIEPVSIDR